MILGMVEKDKRGGMHKGKPQEMHENELPKKWGIVGKEKK